MKVWIDGKIFGEEEAKISVLDHGLLYGDGVFEGIRVYNRNIFLLNEHLDRLWTSAEKISLKLEQSREEMKKAIKETLKESGYENAYIRLVCTRGKGDLGLDTWKCKKGSTIIIVSELNMFFDSDGMKAIIAKTVRHDENNLDPRIKSLNYLNNILAKIESYKHEGVQEAILLNRDEEITECSGDNIFFVKNGKLITPSEDSGILLGITRSHVLKIAEKLGIEKEERKIQPDEIKEMDEAFVTGTGAEIIPLLQIDEIKIGNGKPGKTTQRIIKEFKKDREKIGERY